HDFENPVVVEFINARDDDARLQFFSKFGVTWGSVFGTELIRPSDGYLTASGHGEVVRYQERLRKFLTKVTGTDQVAALEALNDIVSKPGGSALLPRFDLAGEGGTQRMLLQCVGLLDFMSMEVAMAGSHGAKLATCEHCGDVFLTGSLTGRRSHAKYCSARCRVAAMRARNAEQAKSE